jgi:predicted small secreted protein
MRRTLWLSTLLATAALLIAACGTVEDGAPADANAQPALVVAPDETMPGTSEELRTPDYWKHEGPAASYDECFVVTSEASSDDFVVYEPPEGYVWRLFVVTQYGDSEDTHYLFEDPAVGDELETGGYDQVIGCKNREEEPEDDDGPCTRTQGYWKTHSAYGPAPYDATWALVDDEDDATPDEEDTPFYASGLSWYETLHTPPKGGNAYFILAHQFIAAELNALAGAATDAVSAELADAQAFFSANGPDDPPTGQERSEIIELAETLDDYNNGLLGPGHCE